MAALTIDQQKAIAIASARMRAQKNRQAPVDQRDSIMGKVDATMRGAADIMSLGMADELAAGGDALFNPVFGTGNDGNSFSDRYNANLKQQRGVDASDAENRGGYRLAGQIAGGITQGVGLAKNGLSLGANAVEKGAGLGRVALGSAADGAIQGAAQGFGSGEGVDSRFQKAMTGLVGGGALGGATPLAIAGASKALSPIAAPIMARVFPERYAQNALGTALRRSGMSVDDVQNALRSAQEDGQGVFTVADALGNAGQRMLSTVVRNPHDGRREVIEQLMSRQAGQGRRLSNALAEGFAAPDTAAQRVAALKGARGAAADRAYEMARLGLTPEDFDGAVLPYGVSVKEQMAGVPKPQVDVRGVLSKIDERLGPMAGSNVEGDGIDAVLSRFRNRLATPEDKLPEGVHARELSDFSRVLGVKQDLRDEIEAAKRAGRNNMARELGKVHDELDAALEQSSPAYRTANDQFATASKVIEAVDTGTQAAKRGRVEDTIPAFRAMTPQQQNAFRAGYVDPLIENLQGAAGPMTNKARPLISDASRAEFPAFAAPGKAPQLMNRIGREQTMFETANAALGGSKTADNLADAADMAQFDPAIFTAYATGGWKSALAHMIHKAVDGSKGMSPRVVEQVGKSLMQTNPEAAKTILEGGLAKLSKSDKARALVVNALISSGVAIPGRLPSP